MQCMGYFNIVCTREIIGSAFCCRTVANSACRPSEGQQGRGERHCLGLICVLGTHSATSGSLENG